MPNSNKTWVNNLKVSRLVIWFVTETTGSNLLAQSWLKNGNIQSEVYGSCGYLNIHTVVHFTNGTSCKLYLLELLIHH
ncbi:hypothetical protein MTR_2g083595 [Medicago truncatula]|uniref:Uncharacterized protein n=1 Tax=Medicago truncatula TaxID=3880 RepID=A0A072VA12_MEDTR|nr:hypothetical protein MTR_2g083595 [Medicago truncatula]